MIALDVGRRPDRRHQLLDVDEHLFSSADELVGLPASAQPAGWSG